MGSIPSTVYWIENFPIIHSDLAHRDSCCVPGFRYTNVPALTFIDEKSVSYPQTKYFSHRDELSLKWGDKCIDACFSDFCNALWFDT